LKEVSLFITRTHGELYSQLEILRWPGKHAKMRAAIFPRWVDNFQWYVFRRWQIILGTITPQAPIGVLQNTP
jgi:hypothetical protein